MVEWEVHQPYNYMEYRTMTSERQNMPDVTRITWDDASLLERTKNSLVEIYTVDPSNPQSTLVKRCDAPLTMLDGLQAAGRYEARGYIVEVRVVSQPS
jgi:hypothetical protein